MVLLLWATEQIYTTSTRWKPLDEKCWIVHHFYTDSKSIYITSIWLNPKPLLHLGVQLEILTILTNSCSKEVIHNQELAVIIMLHKVTLKSMLMEFLATLKLPSRMCTLSACLELRIIRTLEGTVLHQLIKCSIIFQQVYGGRSHLI
jgi:hypothetical protein